MAILNIVYDGALAAGQVLDIMKRNETKCLNAVKYTAYDAAEEILSRGRQDIAGAGNFGSRWTEGFHVEVKEFLGGAGIEIVVSHDLPGFIAFEDGARIVGKPLLWIPAPWAKGIGQGPAADASYAKNYSGRLVKVTRLSDNKQLLVSPDDGEVKYFGEEEVNIAKKFHIKDIIKDVASKLPQMYENHIAAT